MEKVNVSNLRENLTVFLKKAQRGETVTIVSRGQEIARLVPLEDNMKRSREILRELGQHAHIGDVVTPVGDEWEAAR